MNPQDPNQQPAGPPAGVPENIVQPQVPNSGNPSGSPQPPLPNPPLTPQPTQQPTQNQPLNNPVLPPQPQPEQSIPPQPMPAAGPAGVHAPMAPATQGGSKVLGVLSLVFALFIWPVGLVLGVIAAIKGFTKRDKTLGFMGVGGVLLSLLAMVFTFMVYGWLSGGVDFSKLSTQTVDLGNGEQLSVQVPTDIGSKDDGSGNIKRFNYYESDALEKSDQPSIAIAASGESLPEDFRPVLDDLRNTLDDKSGMAYSIFNQSVRGGIEQAAAEGGNSWMCKDDLKVGDAETASIKGAELVMKFSLECISDVNDRRLYGTAYAGFSENSYVMVIGAALDDFWLTNQEGWQKIFDSIEITKN